MYMRPYIIAGLLVWRASAQVNVLTANGNNQRPNANLQEFQLSPATVSPDTFGKIGSYAVDGLVYAQPLYVTGVNLPGGETRNVVYIATSRNTVSPGTALGSQPGTTCAALGFARILF
jgi:hypothetical protein